PFPTPAGTSTAIVSVWLTRPSPPQTLHGLRSVLPEPPQVGHVPTFTNWPKIDCWTWRTRPAPLHCGQVVSPVPPLPPHSGHGPRRRPRISSPPPVAPPRAVTWRPPCTPPPRPPPGGRPPPPTSPPNPPRSPPKSRMNARSASARSKPLKSTPRPAPAAPLMP